MNPQETAQAVLDQIRAHPETHNQARLCGPTACVAGWAFELHGETEWVYTILHTAQWGDGGFPARIMERAAELLGLKKNDATALFFYTTNEQAVHALEYLAKGDKIDWEAVGGMHVS